MTESLSPGDRFPNVLLRDADGTRALYNWHQGAPVAVVWGHGSGRVSGKLSGAGWASIGLDGDAGTALAIEAGPELGPRARAGTTFGVLFLDRALRVLQRVSAAGVAELVATIDALPLDPAESTGQGLRGSAPVLVLPRVIDPQLRADVIACFRRTGGEPSGVIEYEQGEPRFRVDPNVKMRRDMVIEEPALEARVHAALAKRLLPEISRCFAFEVERREHFKIIAYQAGAGYFRPHRDNDTRDTTHRRFAMTLNLNTGDYRGGCLRFPEFGEHLYEPEPGGALVFSCSLLHEVSDLVEGERLAMTTFFS